LYITYLISVTQVVICIIQYSGQKKKKDKWTNNDLQNIAAQKTKDWAARTRRKWEWTQVLRKGGKLSLLVKWCGFVSAFNIRVKCQPLHIWANTVIIRNSNSLVHCIFNLRDTSCHMYNISSINESPWPRPSFEYELDSNVESTYKTAPFH
jgi:hypothetical protein